jgi:phage shock protein A
MGLEILVIGGVVIFFGGALSFKRVRRFIGGGGSLFMSGVEEQNPDIMIQAATDDFRKKSAAFNNALAQVRGVGISLKNQIDAKQAKLSELDDRIQANVDAGNQELAARYASQHEALESDLKHDQEQYTQNDAAYKGQFNQLQQSQRDFQGKLDSVKTKISQTKMAEASAAAGQAMQGVAFSVGDIGSQMSNLESGLDKRYAKAAGQAALMSDLANAGGTTAASENEQKALDAAALKKFLAKKSGVTPTSQPAAPIAREMGAEQPVGA